MCVEASSDVKTRGERRPPRTERRSSEEEAAKWTDVAGGDLSWGENVEEVGMDEVEEKEETRGSAAGDSSLDLVENAKLRSVCSHRRRERSRDTRSSAGSQVPVTTHPPN